ncbi:MAG: glycosyltransferase [Methanobacteriota archaeon]
MVLLTWNEERHVRGCLAALAAQEHKDFDVLVVDAGSTDRTAAFVREAIPDFPVPLRLVVGPPGLPIGAARNLGVARSPSPFVAFVSADADLAPDWTRRALDGLAHHDMVFGRQLHDPGTWNLGSAARGLRYHFPESAVPDPRKFASNVAAAYHRDVLLSFPFDPEANAAEDLLLARRAAAVGFTATYDPGLLVRHHDVATARGEFRKAIREGHGWAVYRDALGLHGPLLLWGIALVSALVVLALARDPSSAVLLLGVAWAPTLRRVVRRRRAMPVRAITIGSLASPFFDLAFLAAYVGILAARRRPPEAPKETEA